MQQWLSPHLGRRSVLPAPRPDEILRGPLLRTLADRFDTSCILVVAGAGFGKTTVLGQAVRANAATPRGIDAWVSCEPGDEDADHLSRALLHALGAPADGPAGLDRVLGVLAELSPVDVCILIDDLHDLPPGSTGEALVADLIQHLPPHAHLVLASRTPIPWPLARRRARGDVLEIGPDALALSEAEVAAVAARANRRPEVCAGLAGWPALVRLMLSAPVGATRDFLWEEIVAGLTPAERSGLLAVALLGGGTPAEIGHVAGVDVDVGRLARSVPLLHEDDEGHLKAHGLWSEAVERLFPAALVLHTRQQVLQVFQLRGDTVRLGAAAVQWRNDEMLARASCSLVAENLGTLPLATAEWWLAASAARSVETAELGLLAAAVRHTRGLGQSRLNDDLEAIEARFLQRGDTDGVAVTLALGAMVAHAGNDIERLVAVIHRMRAHLAPARHPVLQFLVATFDAGVAALGGDLSGALGIVAALPMDGVSTPVRELALQLQVMMLLLTGRADDAVQAGQPLATSSNVFVRSIPSLLRWSAGDPSEYLATPDLGLLLPPTGAPYRFFVAAHLAVVAACFGDRVHGPVLRYEVQSAPGARAEGRDSALAAAAVAAQAVGDHDERAAAAAVAGHLVRHGAADARMDAHLRHNLALGYVLNDELRRRWDGAELGPSHLRTREVARRLLQARAGTIDRRSVLDSPSIVVTSVPLVWSVELGVRTLAAGCRDGEDLLRSLLEWLPEATRTELDWLATQGDDGCRSAAALVLDGLPDPDTEPLMIDVLGPLRLRRGGAVAAEDGLRRARVRTLLSLLVLRGELRRERICDLLWPDFEPAAAAQNLRVTLSHLRRVLDAKPVPGRSGSTIRSGSDSIGLAGPPLVKTDLDLARRQLHEAEQAGDDLDRLTACLTTVVDLWRGEPLADLGAIDELRGEVEHLLGSLLDACLRLGELHLVAGRFNEALRCAEQARLASPWSERAHRLLLACQLQRHDRAGLESAVHATQSVLDDLGVPAEEPTMMLLRRSAAQLAGDHG